MVNIEFIYNINFILQFIAYTYSLYYIKYNLL